MNIVVATAYLVNGTPEKWGVISTSTVFDSHSGNTQLRSRPKMGYPNKIFLILHAFIRQIPQLYLNSFTAALVSAKVC